VHALEEKKVKFSALIRIFWGGGNLRQEGPGGIRSRGGRECRYTASISDAIPALLKKTVLII
jgi:hypothetical protein